MSQWRVIQNVLLLHCMEQMVVHTLVNASPDCTEQRPSVVGPLSFSVRFGTARARFATRLGRRKTLHSGEKGELFSQGPFGQVL